MKIACSALLIAGAALFAGPSGAIAAPASGGAIKAAAEEIGIGESVHCRPFRHAHPRWHRWRHGCRGAGVMIYERGPRFRHRYGYGVREEFRGGFRSGSSVRGSTTIRSGAGEVSPRATTSGGQAQQGGGAAIGGRQMNSAPTGQSAGGQHGGGQHGGGQHRGEEKKQ
ncbi:MAG: hypothetical protein E6G97_02420 [Alphaproteobacteria bacterium]|nr:MAG: hypothetical protein E6G97_02420 [Alphaproteobacteria bacterium]